MAQKKTMKKYIAIVHLLFSVGAFAQMKKKDYKNIMTSTNIYELNAFLRDTAPEDPRREIIKPKVMELMKEYIKKALPYDQRVIQMQEMLAMLEKKPSTKITFEEMNSIIKQKIIDKLKEQDGFTGERLLAQATAGAGIDGYINPEEKEFSELINLSDSDHKKKTVQLLNSLFDNDPSSKEVIVLIENKSECNIIMRLEGTGNTKYRLPVPANSENSIVVSKGSYLFTSLVCGSQYASQKTLSKASIVSLTNATN